MASRKAPSARERRLGTELRRMRENAGLSTGEGAARVGFDRSNISNMEAGRFGVTGERLRQLAAIYDCPDQDYIDALAELAEQRGSGGWWEEYRGVLASGLLDLAELEYHATRLTFAESIHIPGLLQTEEYALGLFRLSVPKRSEIDIQRRLSHRMKRKTIFERDDPTPSLFYIHEAALLMRLAGTDVQRRQLDRLLEVSQHRHITVRVIPFSAEGYAGVVSGMTYAHDRVPQLDTAGADSAPGFLVMDGPAQLAKYRATLESMDRVALSPRKSQDFIRTTRKQL
jgi:transcriptional regulator with XRE-family HTH domain